MKLRDGAYEYIVVPITDKMYAHRSETAAERGLRLRKSTLTDSHAVRQPKTKIQLSAAVKRAERPDAQAHWAVLVVDKRNRQISLIDGTTVPYPRKDGKVVAQMQNRNITGAAGMVVRGLSSIVTDGGLYEMKTLSAPDEDENNMCNSEYVSDVDDVKDSDTPSDPLPSDWGAASGTYIYAVLEYLLQADRHEDSRRHFLRNGLHRYHVHWENRATWAKHLTFNSLATRREIYDAIKDEHLVCNIGHTPHLFNDHITRILQINPSEPIHVSYLSWWMRGNNKFLVDAVTESDDEESGLNESIGGSSGDEGENEKTPPPSSRSKRNRRTDSTRERLDDLSQRRGRHVLRKSSGHSQRSSSKDSHITPPVRSEYGSNGKRLNPRANLPIHSSEPQQEEYDGDSSSPTEIVEEWLDGLEVSPQEHDSSHSSFDEGSGNDEPEEAVTTIPRLLTHNTDPQYDEHSDGSPPSKMNPRRTVKSINDDSDNAGISSPEPRSLTTSHLTSRRASASTKSSKQTALISPRHSICHRKSQQETHAASPPPLRRNPRRNAQAAVNYAKNLEEVAQSPSSPEASSPSPDATSHFNKNEDEDEFD